MIADRITDRPRLGWQRGKADPVTLADRARDARQWELAARLYREALDRDPGNPPIWVQYGHALKESAELRDADKLMQAEAAYRRAISLDPGAADTYLQLGHILKLQGKIDKAEAFYLRAFAFDPSMPYPLEELGGLGWSEAQLSELRSILGTDAADRPIPPDTNGGEKPTGKQQDGVTYYKSAESQCAVIDEICHTGGVLRARSESAYIQLVSQSGLFHADWYLEQHKDIRDAGIDPLAHYLSDGAKEGRDPNRLFDSDWYIATNPDVAAAGMNPLVHYILCGAAEGRAPHALFDTAWYLKMNPDVSAYGINPLTHYLSRGALEGRAPLPQFDSRSLDAKLRFREQAMRELNAFFERGDRLVVPNAERPVVSILLVVYNQAELTFRCLSALINTLGMPAEVIIVDNASSDDTVRLFDHLDGARILRNSENLHFLRAVNQGAAEARGTALLLLNNDTGLKPGALQAALETLNSASDIGAVGGKLILPDGTLQEAGSIVWNDGTCQAYGRGQDPEAPEYQFQRDVDYCSGAFLLIRRDLFVKLGGLDDTFAPAYYEETDFCMRLRQSGYRVVYDPRVEVLHFEFGSATSPEQASALMHRNHRVFYERHREILTDNHIPRNSATLFARSADRGRPRLLVIDDRVPFPSYGAGYPRASCILKALHEAGYLITHYPLIEPEAVWDEVYSAFPREIEFMLMRGRSALPEFLEARARYYSAIIVSRPHNMAPFIGQRDGHPGSYAGIPIVYDAEALVSPREAARLQLAGNPIKIDEQEKQLREELDLAHAAHAVIAVNTYEADFFTAAGIDNVHVLGHAVKLEPVDGDFADRRDLLFVGALNGDEAPNVDALFWFVEEVMPHLDRLIGVRYRVRVAGRGGAASLHKMSNPRVDMLGRVEDLTEHYGQARVFVAPTRFAAGVPHKLHEAAARGLPAVATGLLATQLGWTNEAELLVADTPEGFARQCARLYTNHELWQRVRNTALTRVATDCNPAEFDRRIGVILSSIGIATVRTVPFRWGPPHDGGPASGPMLGAKFDAEDLYSRVPSRLRPLLHRPQIPAPDLFELRGLRPRGSIAVVLHLFHPDLWDEMREAIERISDPFDLFVSLTQGASSHMRDAISQAFPNAWIFDFENHGRDIGPFFVFLQSGVLFKYDLVCKLHTKRSPHLRHGDKWRRELVDGILGSSRLIDAIVSRFHRDPDLGMVVADGNIYRERENWIANEKRLAELLPRVGISPNLRGRSFPGGSIFWIRSFLLRTLAGVGLDLSDFDPEPLPSDGGLGHAVERMFGLICEDAGMRVAEHSRVKETAQQASRSPSNVHVIAYYLPQFHPVPENDKWWSTGFTEWTNVSRTTPLFATHRQPRLPADLGFYDLRLPAVRDAQAELAGRYGVTAFCYYYYWFNGRRILERPLEEVLSSGKPDFPFLICWANEPWSRNWDGLHRDVLLPQTYQPGWATRFAHDIMPLLRDRRYLRLDDKPMLLIYRIMHIPQPDKAIRELRATLAEAGIPRVHLAGGWVSFPDDDELPADPAALGLDAYFEFPPHMLTSQPLRRLPLDLSRSFAGLLYDYNETATAALAKLDDPVEGRRHRGVMVGWDNTPRRGAHSHIWHGATPANFRRWLRGTFMHESLQDGEHAIFINAWNEWAEGTYIEPDCDFGCGWLEAVASATGLDRVPDIAA
jgi:lipopolysaccharide biosynthesis protein/GT2 family glycosyltransferase